MKAGLGRDTGVRKVEGKPAVVRLVFLLLFCTLQVCLGRVCFWGVMVTLRDVEVS